MHKRCYDNKNPGYKDYGGRGITVCDRWHGPNGLANFIADMGPKPTPKHTIERKNNDRNYCPSNCRWATQAEQNCNKRSSRFIEHDGKRLLIGQWSELLGLDRGVIRKRLARGLPPEEVLAVGVRKGPASDHPTFRNRKSNLFITAHGETRCLAEWAELTGLDRGTIADRLKRGLTGDDVVFVGSFRHRQSTHKLPPDDSPAPPGLGPGQAKR